MAGENREVAVVTGAEGHASAAEGPVAASVEAALESGAQAVLVPAELLRQLCAGRSEAAARRLSRLRHDLNNDLTAVLGFSQLLTRAGLAEAQHARAETILRHAQRMRERLADARA